MSDTIDCPRCGHHHDPDPEIQDMASQCCYGCGFEFQVYVEYAPVYSTQCTECEYVEWERRVTDGQMTVYRVCDLCGSVELKREVQQ